MTNTFSVYGSSHLEQPQLGRAGREQQRADGAADTQVSVRAAAERQAGRQAGEEQEEEERNKKEPGRKSELLKWQACCTRHALA